MELNVTIVVQLVVFLTGVLWLSFVLFRPMLKLMDEREKRIEGQQRLAASLSSSGAEKSGIIEIRLEEARAQALEERKELRDQGQKVYTEAVDKARNEAQGRLTAARQEIEAAQTQASHALKSDAKNLAALVVERVLERPGGAA